MPSVCIVENCKSSQLIAKGRTVSFFSAKKDVLQAWKEVIPTKKKKILTENHVVCELHFREEEIEKSYFTKINGILHEIPKGRATLKKGAVPSVFALENENSGNEVIIQNEKLQVDEELVYAKLCSKIQKIPLPSVKWTFLCTQNFVAWLNWTDSTVFSSKRIVLHPDLRVQVFVKNTEVKLKVQVVKNVSDINALFESVNNFVPCGSLRPDRSETCKGYVMKKELKKRGRQTLLCAPCEKLKTKINRKKKKPNKLKERKKVLNKRCKNIGLKCSRLQKKVRNLKKHVLSLKEACSNSKEDILEKAISELPSEQQTAVRACFSASKVSDKRNMRYTTHWIYECILLRIKSKKTYEHLRKRNILQLPSVQTLSRYLKKLKTSYGFQPYIFKGMEMKSAAMPMEDRRGVLLIDEMKLSQSLSFNRTNLKFEGFTDLGEWTPVHQKQKKGDHALVLMYQPFKGQWVQTLGCFLSVGSASGTVLHKLVLEAIALTEKSGFFIDAVVTDGASWNRSMWSKFGVNEEEISVFHPCSDERRLWFLSDFPHLMKALRNFLVKFHKHAVIYTPDGCISLKHWYALLELLDEHSYDLKVNYKLRIDHLEPKYFQKMNVALAFQFFNVHDALEIYENRHGDLEDSEGTKKFTKRITSLIKAMNCRTPLNAMAPEKEAWKIVEDFLIYLKEWEKKAKGNNYAFMSDNCCYGLKISLKAALEICEFLTQKCNFSYLMTARLNQDMLERFFSLMRDSCGANDHPDPSLFIQMYKLVSTYSLIKPPKGCNIEGPEIFNVLLKLEDVGESAERKEQWESILDTILDKGSCTAFSDQIIANDHDYSQSEASDYAFSYVAGYVSRKGSRFAKYLSEKNRTFVTIALPH